MHCYYAEMILYLERLLFTVKLFFLSCEDEKRLVAELRAEIKNSQKEPVESSSAVSTSKIHSEVTVSAKSSDQLEVSGGETSTLTHPAGNGAHVVQLHLDLSSSVKTSGDSAPEPVTPITQLESELAALRKEKSVVDIELARCRRLITGYSDYRC